MAKRIVDRRKPPAVQKVISAATALAARRDYASWYSTLSEIRLASETHGLGLHERDPCMAVQTVLGKVSLVQLGGPYVTFTANLGMSDATMFDTFRDWLKVARDHVKQPRTGRGKSPSTRLGETQFAQWRAERVVEYAHLLMWRVEKPSRACYTDAALASWIGRDSLKMRRTTEQKLRRALDCLPMLAGEDEREWLIDDRQTTRAALARRLVNELDRDLWALPRYVPKPP